VNTNTLLLGAAGAGLAYYFWKHPQPPKASNGAVTANGRPAAPGVPVTPINNVVTSGAAKGSQFGLSGSASELSLNLAKLFGIGGNKSSLPYETPYVSQKGLDSAASRLLSSSISDQTPEKAAAAAAGTPYNTGVDYNPGPAVPDPTAADTAPDFQQGNSNADFAYA
jgi:hypothetical protein